MAEILAMKTSLPGWEMPGTVEAVRAEALFLSSLQPSGSPSADQIRRSVRQLALFDPNYGGARFKERRSMDPSLLYEAVKTGEVDVISAFSSDGRIAADKLVILTDPKGAIPPYDAVVLISPKRAGDKRLLTFAQALAAATGTP